MKIGVVVFPGSNCDHDALHALGEVLHQPVEFIWHQSQDLSGFDAVVLPGGFSYGDYLRTGAIARFSPVMRAVERFARSGGLVLGICNGFQILCEAGLLPGALMRNTGLRFICRHVHIRVETTATPFTSAGAPGQVLRIPIAHADGNYFCDAATLAELKAQRPDRLPLLRARRPHRSRGQSQRLARRHRRHLQSRAQRPGPDAASRARRRSRARFDRRPGRLSLAGAISRAATRRCRELTRGAHRAHALHARHRNQGHAADSSPSTASRPTSTRASRKFSAAIPTSPNSAFSA